MIYTFIVNNSEGLNWTKLQPPCAIPNSLHSFLWLMNYHINPTIDWGSDLPHSIPSTYWGIFPHHISVTQVCNKNRMLNIDIFFFITRLVDALLTFQVTAVSCDFSFDSMITCLVLYSTYIHLNCEAYYLSSYCMVTRVGQSGRSNV